MENKLQEKEENLLITKSEVEYKLNFLVKRQTNNSKVSLYKSQTFTQTRPDDCGNL